MRIFSKFFLLSLFLLFLTACSEEDFDFFMRQAEEAPALVALDTISKLVTAESVFRPEDTRYEYTPDSLNTLFVHNEYEILNEENTFFYCFDSVEREILGTKIKGNFLALAVSPHGKVLGRGTSALRQHIESLNTLPDTEKNTRGFRSLLSIQNGDCFAVLPKFGAAETSKKVTMSLDEMRAMLKRLNELTPEEKIALERSANEFIQLFRPTKTIPQLQKLQREAPKILRLRLRKDQPTPELPTTESE